jgi:hypothetical protein
MSPNSLTGLAALQRRRDQFSFFCYVDFKAQGEALRGEVHGQK